MNKFVLILFSIFISSQCFAKRGFLVVDLNDTGKRRVEIRSSRPSNAISVAPKFNGKWVTDVRWIRVEPNPEILGAFFAVLDMDRKSAADADDANTKAIRDADDANQKTKRGTRINGLGDSYASHDSLNAQQRTQLQKEMLKSILILLNQRRE